MNEEAQIISLPGNEAVSHLVDNMIFDLHWGDLGMARSIPTRWSRGGLVEPKYNGNDLFKPKWKEFTRQLREALELPERFTGIVTFHITGGRVVRADIHPA